MKRALVAGLMLALGLGVAVAATRSPSTVTPPNTLPNDQPRENPGGQRVSLAYAVDHAGFRIQTPDFTQPDAVAQDNSIHAVWFSEVENDSGGVDRSVLVDYGSGVTVGYSAAVPREIADAEAFYQELADQQGNGLSVVTVGGVPALLNSNTSNGGLASLMLAIDGVRVQVVARYSPAQDLATVGQLEGIAQSILERW